MSIATAIAGQTACLPEACRGMKHRAAGHGRVVRVHVAYARNPAARSLECHAAEEVWLRNPTATNGPRVESRRRQRRDSGAMRQGLLYGCPEKLEAEIDFRLGYGQWRGDPHHPGGGAGAHDIGA